MKKPPVPTTRSNVIDDLRGIAILVMILIHTNAYFLHIKLAYLTLEISQFAVPVFIFCSAYLSFRKKMELDRQSLVPYVKKRFMRLLQPYYLFLVVHFIFTLIAEPKKMTSSYVLNNIFLTGGLDFNWLVLLFIQFTFLIPFLVWLRDNNKRMFYLYTAISAASTLVFLRYTPLPYYRAIMWLPWSLLIVFTMEYVEAEANGVWQSTTATLALILYGLTRFYQTATGHSLFHYSNKYPPNMYHLSYGIVCILLLVFLSKKNVFAWQPLRWLIHFLSVYSYSIYFFHILVIFTVTVFLKMRFTWISFFLTVTLLTLVVQMMSNGLMSLLKPKPVE